MNIELVRAIDLMEFCARDDSASFAHELLRRLITADGARAEGFAPREGLQVKGWDGESHSVRGSEYVPLGHANWEVSAQRAGIGTKAERDFQNRIADARSDETYVAAFLQRWKGKLHWATQKESESSWASVVAYDVDDLIDWLSRHPRVHEWATRRVRGEVRTVTTTRTNELPPLPAALIRRGDLEKEILAALRTCGLVAIWGGPGMGKSTLATAIASDLEDGYPDGVFFVSLSDPDQERSEYESLQRRVVTLHGAMPTGDLSADYRSSVAGRRILVVVDNATSEEMLNGIQVEGVHCIVTSRRRMSGVDSARHVEASFMTTTESAELLRLTGERDTAFSSETVSSVARLCANIPLALQLAGSLAALNPEWGLVGVEAELQQRHGAIHSLSLGDRALRASFQTAVAAIPTAAAVAFRAIAQIPGRVINADLLALASGQPDVVARRSLRTLREYGLVAPTDGVGVYHVHDLLYEYIEELAAAEPLPDARVHRFAVLNWFLAEAARHASALATNAHVVRNGDLPSDVADALRWFDRFVDSLMIGIKYIGDSLNQITPALTALGFATLYFAREQRWTDLAGNARLGRRWVEHTGPDSPSMAAEEGITQRVLLLAQEAEAEYQLGNLERSEALLMEARRSTVGDAEVRAHLETSFGALRVSQGRAVEGLAHYEAAAELTADDPESPAHMTALYNVGVGHFRLNQNAKALPYLERELAAVRALGNRHGEGITLNTLGLVLRRLGRLDDARDALTEAVEALGSTPDRREHANAAYDLATILLDVGDDEAALNLFEREVEIREELGDAVSVARTRATLLIHLSDGGDAADTLAEAAVLLDALGDDVYWQGALRIHRARLLFELGRVAEARSEFRETLALIPAAREAFPRERMLAQLREALAEVSGRTEVGVDLIEFESIIDRMSGA